MDRFAQMILAAARQAEADSGIDIAADARAHRRVDRDRHRRPAVATRTATTCCSTRGPDRVSPFSIPSIIPNMGAGWVSIELGTKGPLMSECTACAASNMAIGDAMDEIRLGRADVMFAGGTEAPITRGRHRRLRRDARALAPQRRSARARRARSTASATAS